MWLNTSSTPIYAQEVEVADDIEHNAVLRIHTRFKQIIMQQQKIVGK